MKNQFLVTIHHTCDDVPMLICEDENFARGFASTIGWDIPEHEAKVLNAQCNTPCCISLTTFEKGQPTKREILRNFDDEDAG